MLEDDADAACSLSQLRNNTFLQERQAFLAVRLTALQDNHRAPFSVMTGIKPVPETEGIGRMRLVYGVIVEVVDGHLDPSCRVEIFERVGMGIAFLSYVKCLQVSVGR